MLSTIQLAIWFLMILSGGYLFVRVLFNVSPEEEWILGIAGGISANVVFAAIITRLLPAPLSFYLSAALVFLFGILLTIFYKKSLQSLRWKSLSVFIPFLFVVWVSFRICRGMAIFDDYAHLPTTSLMALGQVPPVFAYDPSVTYAYHYFLMLFAAQFMRIGDVLPWTALDITRSISFGLAVILAGFWAYRITRSRWAALIGGFFMAMGGGTRWLSLFLPEKFFEKISDQVYLIGSGATSGANILEAIQSNWKIEGIGKLYIPFGFTNGIVQPGILSIHGPNGLMGMVLLLFILLTWNRWKGIKAAGLTAIILSGISLVNESDLLLVLGGWALVFLARVIQIKSLRVDKKLWIWGGVIAAAIILSIPLGGAFQDILLKWINPSSASYQTVGFVLNRHPSIVSAHLGPLSLLNFRTALLAFFELGPVILLLPLLVYFGIRSFHVHRWVDSMLIFGFLLTLATVFVNFEGSTGVRNTSRLYSFLTISFIYFVPLAWMWLKQRKYYLQYAGIAVGSMMCVSGIVVFSFQLPSMITSAPSYYMNELDAQILDKYWNTFDQDAMVFDAVPSRAVTVFGRAVNAGKTWYEFKPEWKALVSTPDPYDLLKAGYNYVYMDEEFWAKDEGTIRIYYSDPCVKQMEFIKAWPGLQRRLFDISKCN